MGGLKGLCALHDLLLRGHVKVLLSKLYRRHGVVPAARYGPERMREHVLRAAGQIMRPPPREAEGKDTGLRSHTGMAQGACVVEQRPRIPRAVGEVIPER